MAKRHILGQHIPPTLTKAIAHMIQEQLLMTQCGAEIQT